MTQPAPDVDVLSGWGITARLGPAWEGRLYVRPSPTDAWTAPGARAGAAGAAGARGGAAGVLGWSGEQTTPVLHVANFPLPAARGDFGSGAVERMTARHAFVALMEFGQAERGTALYSSQGMPSPRLRDFSPAQLQHRQRGQLGYQRFFSVGTRPFCLFMVLGDGRGAAESFDQATEVLEDVEIA